MTIAAYSSIATHWLPAVIRVFQQDYPHVSIRLMEGIWQEVSGWLDDRTADIGFFSYQEGMPYEWIPLAEDPMLALLPQGHPLADASAYPLKDCEKDDFIMPALGCDDDVEALFRHYGIVPKIRFTTMENFSAMSMVEQGLGISIMNQLITEGHICNVVKLPLGSARPNHQGSSPALPGGRLPGGENVFKVCRADADTDRNDIAKWQTAFACCLPFLFFRMLVRFFHRHGKLLREQGRPGLSAAGG